MKSKRALLLGLFVAIAAAAVYLPALGNGFVEWDDHVYVYESEGLKLSGIEFVKWAFTAVVSSNWHPLTMLVYGAEYRLFGLDPFGYHLINLILHAANTFLVFALALKIIGLATGGEGKDRALAGAAMGALAFGLHPQHVESVAWVSELKDVLCGLFFLLSILAYWRYTEGGRKALFYMLSIISFILALMSKPMAVSLPAALLIFDYYPLGRLGSFDSVKKAVIEKLPFFTLAALGAVATVWAQSGDEAIASLAHSPLSERMDVAIRGFAFYLKKLFVPVDLVPFYVRPLEGEFFNHVFWVSLAAFIAISAACIVLRKKALTAAWLYYAVTLLPVIGIVQVSDMAAADRYSYLPALGPVVFLSGIAAFIAADRRRMITMIAMFAPIAAMLGFLTVKQIPVWKDTVSLWTQEIKVYPTIQAYMKRAKAYELSGRFEEAAADYTVIIRNADKDIPVLLVRRAAAYLNAGYPDMALEDYALALKLETRNAAAYLGRATVFMEKGDYISAANELERVLELAPGNPAVMFNLGVAYDKAGQKEKGMGLIREANRLGHPEAAGYLAASGE